MARYKWGTVPKLNCHQNFLDSSEFLVVAVSDALDVSIQDSVP